MYTTIEELKSHKPCWWASLPSFSRSYKTFCLTQLTLSLSFRACRRLVETKKSQVYPLIDQLIHLVLTLPVSITTGERAFLAMKIVKIRLRNKMEDEFLSDNLSTLKGKLLRTSLLTQYLMTLDLLKSIGYNFEKRCLTFMLLYVLRLCLFHIWLKILNHFVNLVSWLFNFN